MRKCLKNVQNITCLTKLSHGMRMWKTTTVLNAVENTLNAGYFNINSDIFQGDSLSYFVLCDSDTS